MSASPDTSLRTVGTHVPAAPAAPQGESAAAGAPATHGNAGHGAASLIPHLQRRQAQAAAASPRDDQDAQWSVLADLDGGPPRP